MIELVVLALIGAVAFLWRRVDALERELAAPRPGLSDTAAAPIAAQSAGAPSVGVATPAAPAASAVPVPATRNARDSVWSGISLPRFDFEDLFGRMLPIWAGGVTLAAAGFFLVRWSIDAGLLTPAVRVLFAGLFGIALVAGAEVAFRWRERVADPRVSQALAGAGLATLYAAFYLAGSTYGLIGSTFAFMGLAVVTAAAIGLSFRFGLPSAVLALVGGFAAPALVGGEQANVPLLTLYLALITVGLAFTGRRQDRAWLGIAALAGGLGWGALLIAGGTSDLPSIAMLGAYLVLLGGIVPVVAGGTGRPHWLVRVGAAGLAALQLAVLVQQGGFGALEWGLYLLLGSALAWFGWREPAMREANALAAAVGVALIALWPAPDPRAFVAVACALAIVFAGAPLAQLWRGHGRALDSAQATGVALGLAGTMHIHLLEGQADGSTPIVALGLAATATVAALAAWLAARAREAHPRWAWVAQGAAALLAYDAVAQVASQPVLAWVAALAVLAIVLRAHHLLGALTMATAIAFAWAIEPLAAWLDAGIFGLIGPPILSADLPSLRAVAEWLLPVAVASGAWRMFGAPEGTLRRVLEGIALITVTVAAHVVYRVGFGAIAGADFVSTGVIERTAWEALLLGVAWVAHSRGWPRVGLALALVSLAHFAWFSAILHNPLWSVQAVGLLPLANALVPAYAMGLAALALICRLLPREPFWLRWAVDAATMAVLALFALSELRQLFSGSILTTPPIGQTEDLLRSLMGIVLAISFLLWGSRGGGRSWRIGSLAAMVIALLKVFLVDAAGLEGLGRVASFMALGFSLIGIGWFYNRQLRAPVPNGREQIAAPQ